MAQIGEPKRVIIVQPVYIPVPAEPDVKPEPAHEPVPEEPQEVPE